MWFPPFDAPDADLAKRPVLTFLVSHSGEDSRLVITLNTIEIVGTTFTTTPTRAWIEVVNHDILQLENNEMMATVSEGAGEITFSNLVLTYKNVITS